MLVKGGPDIHRLACVNMMAAVVLDYITKTQHNVIIHVSMDVYIYGYMHAWWHHQLEIFRVTGPLCGEFPGHQWIPLTKASDAELWCFLWSAPEQTVK